jgi:hypothetical protein
MNQILSEIIKNYDLTMIYNMSGHARIQGEIYCHDIFSLFYLHLREKEKDVALAQLKKEALLFEEEMNTLPSMIKDNEVALESFKEKLKEYQQGLADDALEAYYLKEVEGVFEP